MSSEGLHAPRDRLSAETLALHQAITSLIEELEAVDWYRQRGEDCEDPELRDILFHNMREEMEHASMVLEWIRRHSADFEAQLRDYLFTDKPITAVEGAATGKDDGGAGEAGDGEADEEAEPQRTMTVGDLKD